ncbi:MAG TPA: glycerate kinase [Stellaceae bacterium]|nr:glycerate kinase [Stellaceae bacterium]
MGAFASSKAGPALADPRALLRRLFEAALAAADPATVVPPHLPAPPEGRTIVVGAGKAAAAMAAAVEKHWPGPLAGLVVTRYGHGLPCTRIEVVEAGHPVPDAAGSRAAQHILELVRGLGADDLVLCLISGGGSALLTLPAPGISLEDKRAVTRALLTSGATISEMNCLRKHLSAIKGGRLAAAAAPARIVSLAISDVPGDDPAVIASGPTVPDPTTFAEARAILAKYGIEPPAAAVAHLAAARDETPKPGDPRLAHAEYHLIATPQGALEAAAAAARAAGITPVILGDAIEGEAKDVALVHAGIARQAATGRLIVGDRALMPPLVLLSGGETTVTVRGRGRGGRNAEFLLALAVALNGAPGIHAIACDTDGIDGTEDNAGAIVGPDSFTRASQAHVNLKAKLAENDAYGAFEALGDLVVTGATRTNVNDFRAILILHGAS